MQTTLFPQFKPAHWQKANLTCLQGHLDISFYELIEVLGEPHDEMGDKTQAEWALEFEDGTIATIYDYKEWRHVESVRDWHIGGHNSKAIDAIKSLFPNCKVRTSHF